MANNPTVLLLNKEADQTSFSFLGPIKKLIDPKVGHTGTLDRFATGLMIVLTGPLTKLNTLFSNLDKTYLATVRFGSETDTLDPEGKVIATAPIPQLETVEKVLKEHFSGVISQQPPQYSAIHVKGERAYRLARQGQRFSMPTRDVEIFDTQILGYNQGDLKIKIHCSKGTYIRAIARDLGELCGSKGHLTKLQRIAIGPYCIEESVGADDYPNLRNHAIESVDRLLRLPQLGQMAIDKESSRRFCYGNLPDKNSVISRKLKNGDKYAALFTEEGLFIGVIAVDKQQNPLKVLSVACSRQ